MRTGERQLRYILYSCIVLSCVSVCVSCLSTKGGLGSQVATAEGAATDSGTDPQPAPDPASPDPTHPPVSPPTPGSPTQPSQPAQPPKPTSPPQPEKKGLKVDSWPWFAEVWIDGHHAGHTPFFWEGCPPGYYEIEVLAEGYRPFSAEVSIPPYNPEASCFALLEKVSGFLDISLDPLEAVVFVDGARVSDGGSRSGRLKVEAAPGERTIKAIAFGYEEAVETALVKENETAFLAISLEPAEFRLDPGPVSLRFDPESQGRAGLCRATYFASGPGSGKAILLDATGSVIREEGVGPFRARAQEWAWDGLDGEGRPAPSGTYRLVLRATAPDGSRTSELEYGISLDREGGVRHGSLQSGISGLVFVPDAEALPPWAYELSFASWSFSGSSWIRMSSSLGLRLGLGLIDTELALSGYTINYDTNPDAGSFAMGLSLKKPLFTLGSLKASVSGRASSGASYVDYGPPTTDAMAAYPGLAAGLGLELSASGWSLLACPEIVYSTAYPNYLASGTERREYAWAYVRGGLRYSSRFMTIGASFAARSSELGAGMTITGPYEACLEAHAITDMGLIFSAYALCEFMDLSDYYLSFGLGLGFLSP